MKNGKILFSIIILTCFLSFLTSSAYAEWEQIGSEGTWLLGTRTEWHVDNSNEHGYLNYSNALNNFTGYHARINFTIFCLAGDPSFHLNPFSDKMFRWTLELKGSNGETALIYLRIHEVTNTWGWIKDRFVHGDIRRNETSYYDDKGCPSTYYDLYNPLTEKNYIEIYAWRDNDDLKADVLLISERQNLPINLKNNTFTMASGWFDNMTLYLRYEHEGYGTFNGGMDDTIYTNDPYDPSIGQTTNPQGLNFWDALSHDLHSIAEKVLPSWLLNFVGQFSAWGGWMLSILSAIAGGFIAILPFTPLILIMYLLDVGLTSVHEGSFTPMGNFFNQIVGLVTGIISTLVSIGQAIYDFIHFW